MLDVIHKRQSTADTEFARNWVLGSDNQIYFYDYFETRKRRFINFNILYVDKEFRLQRRVSAGSATWQSDRALLLRRGWARNFLDNLPGARIPFRQMPLEIAENGSSSRKK